MMVFLKARWVVLVAVLVVVAAMGATGYSYLQRGGEENYSDQLISPSPGSADDIDAADPVVAESADVGSVPGGMPACICHSKNPSMVRMHDALEGENCGSCHGPDENLMAPGRAPTARSELDKRKASESICKDCHQGDRIIVRNKPKSKNKVKISDALFCPKCKKQLSPEDKDCDGCGGAVTKAGDGWTCSSCGPLVDINKVAALSKENPSNDICRLCHFDDSLAVAHKGVKAYNKVKPTTSGELNDCLGCHESHNQCGGCHF